MKANLILIAIISFLLLSPSQGIITKNVKNETIKMENGEHFHAKSNSSWFVIKFSCDKTTTINELYVAILSNLTYKKGESHFYLLIDKNFNIYSIGGGMVYFYSFRDLFFHLNFLFFNFTIDHFSKGNFYTGGISWDYNITLPPNIYYLICIGTKSKNTQIEVWINTSDAIRFLASANGNTTYFLDETDFLGNLNFCWYGGSIIIMGEKYFNINNTMIGYILVDGGIGITTIKMIDSKGEIRKTFILDLGFGKHKNWWGKRRLVFGNDTGLIIGEMKGVWKVRVNMIESTAIRVDVTPNIMFHYGDVILP